MASIHAQTFQNFEIIAVDDGSADETLLLLEAWALEDPRVIVLRQPASGIVAALQRAVDASQGEILVRMDADDVAYSNRIEKQVELLDADPELGVCGTLVRYFPRNAVQGGTQRYELWINALVEHDDIARDIFVECPIAHPTMAIRRTVLEQVGGYQDRGWPEDYDLLFRLWQHGIRMGKVPEVLLRWRDRADRTSRVDNRYDEDAFRRCKVHYLKASVLNGHDDVVIWGAGPVGKAFAAELQAQEVAVRAFIEVDHRKVGQKINSVPVVGIEKVDSFRGSLLLAAVGQINGREEIRATLSASGWVEGSDYVAVA